MAYELQVGMLFAPGINTEDEVFANLMRAQKVAAEIKTVTSWGSEGDNSTLEFGVPLPYYISECIYFLRRVNPKKYGYLVTAARQIRF